MRLSDRTVIVTGGAAGIGATYAAGLVHEGTVVYLADVADGSSLAAGLSGRGPGSAVFVRTDIGDEDSVRSLVRMVIEDRSRIDVLVNNEIVEALIMASNSAWTTTVAQALHLEDDVGTSEFTGYF